MTDTHENTAPAADQNEQGSGTIPEAQEVLEDNSSDKGALPSINFDVPTENIPQRQLTTAEILEMLDRASKAFNLLLQAIQNITANAPSPAEISDFLFNKMQPFFENFKEAKEYAELLKPYIEKELKKSKKLHPEIENISPEDIAKVSVISLMGADEAETKAFLRDYSDKDPILENIDTILDILRKAKENFAAASNKDLLPQISPILPHSHLMPNNTLMNYLTQFETVNAGKAVIPVLRGKRDTTDYVLVEYTDDPNLSAFSLSEYERQVSDSIITIWVEAMSQGIQPLFTTDMVFKNMPGGGGKPSPQQKGAITKAIEKFRHLHVYVNATEEMRARGLIDNTEEFVYDDMYLSATRGVKCVVKNGGQTVEGYRINVEPIIYQYCQMTNQILTVPRKCIEVKQTKKNPTTGEITISTLPVSMTTTRQAMTGYIIRRIEILKRDRRNNKKQQSDIIRFDTLFNDVGLENQDRNRAKENRKFCYQYLDYLTAIKSIKGYEEQKKGRSITGVKILL